MYASNTLEGDWIFIYALIVYTPLILKGLKLLTVVKYIMYIQ